MEDWGPVFILSFRDPMSWPGPGCRGPSPSRGLGALISVSLFLPGSLGTVWRCQIPLGKFTAAAGKAGTAAPERSQAWPELRSR